jgi:hypothetical protein
MAYSDAQQMMMLAYAVDTWLTKLTGNDESDAQNLYSVLSTNILPAMNANAGSNWTIVWGPWVKSEPYTFKWNGSIIPQLQYRIVNAMMIVSDGSNYAISIAGTDFRSAYDWVLEDLSVLQLRKWSDIYPGTKAPSEAKVSLAMHKGYSNLVVATPPANVPGTATTLMQFLGTIPSASQLFVTGHSLGGALAPVMGLWIADQQSSGGLFPNFAVNVYSYAGPTPGEAYFQSYYDMVIGSATQRIWNPLDLVPNAWNHDLLKTLQAAYNANDPPYKPNVAENALIDGAATVGSTYGYVHVEPDAPSLTNPAFNPDQDSFGAQVFYQHIADYPVLLDVALPPIPPWPPEGMI